MTTGWPRSRYPQKVSLSCSWNPGFRRGRFWFLTPEKRRRLRIPSAELLERAPGTGESWFVEPGSWNGASSSAG